MPRPKPILRGGWLTLDMVALVEGVPELRTLNETLVAAGYVFATKTARCRVGRDHRIAIRLRWVYRTRGGPTLRRVEEWKVPVAALFIGAALDA
jgi:hypothetical protein